MSVEDSEDKTSVWGFIILLTLICIMLAAFIGVGIYGKSEYWRTRHLATQPVKPQGGNVEILQDQITMPMDHAAMHKRGEQLKIDDLKECVRDVSVTIQEESKAPPESTLPRVPQRRHVEEMSVGEEGWVGDFEAHEDKLYVFSFDVVMPVRTEATEGVYRDSTPDYFVHIRRNRTGVEVDCDQPSPHVYSPNSQGWQSFTYLGSNTVVPVNGMFHGSKK